MFWIDQVCAADYFAKNWENPRYPQNFWVSFTDSTDRMGFNWSFSPEELVYLEKLAKPYLSKKYGSSFSLCKRVRNYPYGFRLSAGYRQSYAVRWMHTSARPLHTASAFFLRNFFDRIILIRENWAHYSAILKAESIGQTTTNIDPNCYMNFPNSGNNFKRILEENLCVNFLPIVNHGVVVQVFENQKLDTRNQPEPDNVFDFSNSIFRDKAIHGMDQKSGKTSFGNSEILSGVTPQLYIKKLRKYEAVMRYQIESGVYDNNKNASSRDKNFVFDSDVTSLALQDLAKTCDNIDIHQIMWAKNMHIFHSNYIPPIRVPSHFSIKNMRPVCVNYLESREMCVRTVSDFLYEKNVPQYKPGDPMPVEALNLFENSFIQRLLAE